MTVEIQRQIYAAVKSGDVAETANLLKQYPELIDEPAAGLTWLDRAASASDMKMVRMLLELGANINPLGRIRPDGPLSRAVSSANLETIKYLLDQGANPNAGRLLIGAMNRGENAFEVVKLLVEYGVDVNQCFQCFGEDGFKATALSWAIDSQLDEIAQYLRSHGAQLPPSDKTVKQPQAWDEEVVEFFRQKYGSVRKQSLHSVIPESLPITVHVVEPSVERNQLILFTTGVASKAIAGQPDLNRCAELIIHLPSNWPLDSKSLKQMRHAWPVQWLKLIGGAFHDIGNPIQGPFNIIANGDPATPIAPGLKFDSMLVVEEPSSEGLFFCEDGKEVHFYTLYPLYPEERLLEKAEGIESLLALFYSQNISTVVDINRPNVATHD
jgi:uncharacterized protein